MIVIVPLGPNLAMIPGDLGDARLNNFLLEHFFRWVSGLDKSFWNANFYYPYPYTIAFSDNFLGSGFFYALFRWAGLDRETAFQGWYILGFVLNYASAAYVLSRFKFNPFGVAAGALFFSFGLPVLAQVTHVQLLYRFGIPLTCFCLWQMFDKARLLSLVGVLFWTVWQFYLSIYTGVFLIFLLFSMAVLLPFFKQEQSFAGLVNFWPGLFITMWKQSTSRERLFTSLSILFLLFALAALLWPYYQVTKLYGFTRNWYEVSTMLPNWRSYITADQSLIWRPISKLIKYYSMRHEHNLFIGLPALICIVVSIAWHQRQQNRKLVFLHLFATILLIILTFKVRRFSLYSIIIWQIPGLNSIRAITRIILILMWPISICIAYTIDQLLNRPNKHRVLLSGIAYGLVLSLMIEPILFDSFNFNKVDSQKRIDAYLSEIPSSVPDQPILFLAHSPNKVPLDTDIDAMLLAQRLGWPGFNGYSGNEPPGYESMNSCRDIQHRILAYMDFAEISSETYYLDMINRVVPLGLGDCNPTMKERMPRLFAGPLSQEIFDGITIDIISLQKTDSGIQADVLVTNQSSLTLPAFSSTENPVLLAWRLVNSDTNQDLPDFNETRFLDNDIGPGKSAVLTFHVVPPEIPGEYQLEVTAVQAQISWFYDRGLPIEKSSQVILVDAQNNLTIPTPTP